MSIIEALVLGIVQGLTEFIPVSSSGHLLLLHDVFNTTKGSLAFDVALHVGTLVALLVHFRRDIKKLLFNLLSKNADGRLARLLLLATIPAGLAGLLLAGFLEAHARATLVVACTLGIFGLVMLAAERFAGSKPSQEISTKQGMAVGFAQVLALIPGVSRSGATITAGMFMGLARKQATSFAFLLGVPIIAGSAAGVLLQNTERMVIDATLLVGMTAAFASGLFAIKLMLKTIEKLGLKPFAYYRLALALLVIVFGT